MNYPETSGVYVPQYLKNDWQGSYWVGGEPMPAKKEKSYIIKWMNGGIGLQQAKNAFMLRLHDGISANSEGAIYDLEVFFNSFKKSS